jgi:hypothetical protein
MASLGSALGAPPTEKLTRDNHLFWKTQVLPALRGAQVMGLLDGSDKAPAKHLEVEDSEKVKKACPIQPTRFGLREIKQFCDIWLKACRRISSLR